MRPANLSTKIFLDGGNPEETRKTLSLLGFLDGQTTNPTLIAKSPGAEDRLKSGNKFSKTEIYDYYKNVVSQISALVPDGSVSIEVYTDQTTSAQDMITQAKEMFAWIPNAHIKLPISPAGLRAAEELAASGMRLNLTLCFSEEQAAAVYSATYGAAKGAIYVSPFVGRLDDRGENGMELIAHILKLYRGGDGHVAVLTASVRTMDHFMKALALQSDIITAPFRVLEQWAAAGMPVPEKDFAYSPKLASIPYHDLDLDSAWESFNIGHELTTQGIDRFAADWNALIQ